ANLDLAALGRVLDGVVDQVEEDLPQPPLVAPAPNAATAAPSPNPPAPPQAPTAPPATRSRTPPASARARIVSAAPAASAARSSAWCACFAVPASSRA